MSLVHVVPGRALYRLDGGSLVRIDAGGGGSPAEFTGTAPPDMGLAVSFNDLSDLDQATTDARMAEIAGVGGKWLRVDIPAVQIESPGPTRNWAVADRIIASAKSAGLKVACCLTTIPAYARSETLAAGGEWRHGAVTQAQREVFRDFGVATIRRYQQVDAWEVWNEPNFTNFWQPTPTDGAAYYALLAACYQPFRNAAPSTVPIITGGTAGVNDTTAGVEARQWYIDLYGRGLKTLCDGVAVHPYPDIGFTNSLRPFAGRHLGTVGSSGWNATGGTSEPLVAGVRATMDANGDSAKAIWGTETGWPTWGTGVTEETQARSLPEVATGWVSGTARESWALGPRGPLMWYELRDSNTAGTTTAEEHFGLLRSDGTEKPAANALRSVAGFKQTARASSTTLTNVTITPTLNTAATAGRVLLSFLTTDKGSGSITAPGGYTALGVPPSSASIGGQLAAKVAVGGETSAAWTYVGTNAGTGGWASLTEIDLGSVNLASALSTVVLDNTTTVGTISADLGNVAPSAGWLIAATGLDLPPSSRTNPWPGGWAELHTHYSTSPNAAFSVAVRLVAAGAARSVIATWGVSDQKFLALTYIPDA